MDEIIIKYNDKKVLILGLGLNQGGVGSAKFFAEAGAVVKVTDLKSAAILKDSVDQLKSYSNIEFILGEHRYEDIDWADIIIRNPALKPHNEYRVYAEKSGKPVETDMGIFLQFVNPKKVIGVTGTKGKSTTSSLIYEVIKANKIPPLPNPPPRRWEGTTQNLSDQGDQSDSSAHGVDTKTIPSPSMGEGQGEGEDVESKPNVVFAGNIGVSILDTIAHLTAETFVVLELSSFQLEAWKEHKVSPHIAVITNIFPDHLDYYGSMEEYVSAKKIIALNQTEDDFLLIPEENEFINDPNFLNGLKASIKRFSTKDLPYDFFPKIKGEHNLPNCAAAFLVSKILGFDEQKSAHAIEQFKGVPFRQQIIKEWNGITIINDTAATTPDAAIQAIKTFPKSILIAGGMNKGLAYEGYAKAIDEYAKSVYFIDGTGTDELKKLMEKQEKIKGTWDNFEAILEEVKKESQSGDTIIFSPGGTSFNFFQNEFDRGRKFNLAIEKVFK